MSKQELRFSTKLDGHGTQEKRSVGVILTEMVKQFQKHHFQYKWGMLRLSWKQATDSRQNGIIFKHIYNQYPLYIQNDYRWFKIKGTYAI